MHPMVRSMAVSLSSICRCSRSFWCIASSCRLSDIWALLRRPSTSDLATPTHKQKNRQTIEVEKHGTKRLAISLSDTNRFSEYFHHHLTLPYLTLPPGWACPYTCPTLRPYQLGPMRIPECNHKVTGSGYKAVDGCEAVNRRLWSRNQHKSTGNV